MTDDTVPKLSAEALQRFRILQPDAAAAVTERFYAMHAATYAPFGARGRAACREDLALHLEFLQPALEFGLLQPMAEYLHWLAGVLAARGIPADHLALSLDLLAEFFADRMAPDDSAAVGAALHAAKAEYLRGQEAPGPPLPPCPPWPEAATFEAALLAGDQRAAMAVVNRCLDSGQSLVDVELHDIQTALYHIGERWQANRLSVAAEHLATAIAQAVMTAGLLRSPVPEAVGKRVLLACVAGNHHAVGLRMVADAFQLAGWDVRYLGANVPGASIVQFAADWRADLLGLSASFAQHLRTVRETITLLRDTMGASRPAVMVGGLAINRFNRLADIVGADAWSSDAQAAVARAGELVGV